jgi:methyl-accepting chemotaxis protein/methyl-accepting chemotaxis protein-1 (serine sensor receptor)
MGFAVVADEVRNLAQRCAQAAKDTATLIEESISKANEGRAKLEDVNSSIAAITESARTVKTLVDEVNLGSQDQARGIDQIAKAIAQMERVTQKTAASAEESASASEEMSTQARAFQTLVDQLQGMVGAGGEELRVPGHADRPAKTQKPPGRVLPPAARPAHAGKTSGEAPHPATQVEVAPAVAARAEFPLDDDFREF